jgi:cysteine synthase B
VTHFVAGLGTSGTFVGTSRRLKELNPAVRCISVQPAQPWHGLEGLKHMATAIVPGIYDPSIADADIGVETEPAYELARRLAREEGILAGHSSGAALWAVREVARGLERGVVVTLLADGGDRYVSTGLYRGQERR